MGALEEKGPQVSQRAKTTYTTIAGAEKQSKRSKKGPFCYIYIYWGPSGVPTQEIKLMGPEGKVPPGPPGVSSHACNAYRHTYV